MSATPVRLCLAALLLLAGCSSAPDEMTGTSSEGAGAAGATDLGGLEGGRAGVLSSDLPPGVQPGSQEDLQVTVGDRIYFDYDSAVLTPTATQTLGSQAAWLQGYQDVTVTIEGHADERGTREYNLALGDRRANAVKNYLIALNVDPVRILTISYGEERPAEPGHDEAALAKNRRAVTVVNTVN
jgi:peptidoglycan-associated lipoprotein